MHYLHKLIGNVTKVSPQQFNSLLTYFLEVKLNPTQKSQFSRAQTQPDRICTLEAIVLLLEQMGEKKEVCETLLNALSANVAKIEINKNQEMKPTT
jgi:hypothetical protein